VSRRICIVAATLKEVEPLIQYFETNAIKHSSSHFQIDDLEIDILITGIGVLHTTYSLMNYLTDHQPHAWIQMGIGGAVDTSLEIGSVFLIESETVFDFGAQDKDGRVINAFELGWMDSEEFPYSNSVLSCFYILTEKSIPFASGMTTIHSLGFQEKIEKISEGLHGQIENMEGAAFFYVSLMKSIPFLSLRSISNYVEVRDTSKWNIAFAINQLNEKIIFLLHQDNGFLKSIL
jgi:futalosine hydrolase